MGSPFPDLQLYLYSLMERGWARPPIAGDGVVQPLCAATRCGKLNLLKKKTLLRHPMASIQWRQPPLFRLVPAGQDVGTRWVMDSSSTYRIFWGFKASPGWLRSHRPAEAPLQHTLQVPHMDERPNTEIGDASLARRCKRRKAEKVCHYTERACQFVNPINTIHGNPTIVKSRTACMLKGTKELANNLRKLFPKYLSGCCFKSNARSLDSAWGSCAITVIPWPHFLSKEITDKTR